MNYSNQKIRVLVTGAGGFVGLKLTRALLLEGYDVTTLQRGTYPELNELKNIYPNLSIIQGSINDQNILDFAVSDVNAIFHVASKIGMWGSYDDYYETNVVGTQNILKSMKKYSIKNLVYTSTPSVVFDRGDINNGDESLPYPKSHLNFYAQTKRIAEEEILKCARAHEFNALSIRPHLVFGPGDKQLIPRVIYTHLKGKLKIVGDGENLVDVSYIDNVVHAHLLAFKTLLQDPNKVNGKAYFIGQEKPVKLWNFTNDIFKGLGLKKLEKKIPVNIAYCIGGLLEALFKLLGIKKIDPPMTRFVALQLGKNHYFSHENAKKDFGYIPIVPTEEGLKNLIHDYRSRESHILSSHVVVNKP